MRLECFHQTARPAFALKRELAHLGRHVGERQRIVRISDAITFAQQRPRQDDIFADAFGPTTYLFQRLAPIDREGPLGYQSAVVHSLHPLHRSDAMEIIPLLRATQEVLARIADHHCAGNGMRVFGIGQQALDNLAQSVALDPGIPVDCQDQIMTSRGEPIVEHGRLSSIDFEIENPGRDVLGKIKLGDRLFRQPHCRIGRPIVEDQHFDLTRVILTGKACQRVADRRFLVVGRHQNARPRVMVRDFAGRPSVEEQCRYQERIHEARHVRNESDRHQSECKASDSCQVANPGKRKEDAQYGPADGN